MEGTLAIVRNIEDIQARKRAEEAATDLRNIIEKKDDKIKQLQEELREVRRENNYFRRKNADAYRNAIRGQKEDAPEWTLVKVVAVGMAVFGVIHTVIMIVIG